MYAVDFGPEGMGGVLVGRLNGYVDNVLSSDMGSMIIPPDLMASVLTPIDVSEESEAIGSAVCLLGVKRALSTRISMVVSLVEVYVVVIVTDSASLARS